VDPAYRARDEDLRRWSGEFPDTTRIAEVEPRYRAKVVGVVSKIRLVPDKSIEVTIEDGSGRGLTGLWTGRTRLPGIELGAGLVLTGTVAAERDGSLRMRNPEYATIAGPYAAM
jgi:hypothetical protein